MIIQFLIMALFEIVTKLTVMPLLMLLSLGIYVGIRTTEYAITKMVIEMPGVIDFRSWVRFLYVLSRQLLMVFIHYPVAMISLLLISVRLRLLKAMVYSRYTLMVNIGMNGEDYLAEAKEKLRDMG